MKHFLLAVVSAISFITTPVAADDTSALTQAPATSATPASAAPGQKMAKFKQALAQLNLTDAQKDQIKQIRSVPTDRKERRQQIMAVLTPEQKATLLQMIKEHGEAAQGSAAATANGDKN